MLTGQIQLRATLGSILGAFCACSLLLAQPAMAVEMESLYTVEVPLDSQNPDARAEAYSRALGAVLVRVTGLEQAAEDEGLLALFPNPARYVLQFRRGEGDSLIVSLDGAAIEQLLKQAGQPVWGSDRPLTLVWLAVDWGGGEREIVASDNEPALAATRSIDRNRLLRERVKAVAQRRGVAVVFPLVDTVDLASLSFGDIWGGFDEPLLDASRRYGTTSVLVGRIRAEELLGDRWTFYFGDRERQWTGSPEMAVNELANLMAEQFAYAGDAPIEIVPLSISGIDSVFAYGTVQRYLKNLSVIEGHSIDTASGNEILFQVQIQGGRERLAAALEFSGILERQNWLDARGFYGETETAESLEFIYLPQLSEAVELDDTMGSFDATELEGNVP